MLSVSSRHSVIDTPCAPGAAHAAPVPGSWARTRTRRAGTCLPGGNRIACRIPCPVCDVTVPPSRSHKATATCSLASEPGAGRSPPGPALSSFPSAIRAGRRWPAGRMARWLCGRCPAVCAAKAPLSPRCPRCPLTLLSPGGTKARIRVTSVTSAALSLGAVAGERHSVASPARPRRSGPTERLEPAARHRFEFRCSKRHRLRCGEHLLVVPLKTSRVILEIQVTEAALRPHGAKPGGRGGVAWVSCQSPAQRLRLLWG